MVTSCLCHPTTFRGLPPGAFPGASSTIHPDEVSAAAGRARVQELVSDLQALEAELDPTTAAR